MLSKTKCLLFFFIDVHWYHLHIIFYLFFQKKRLHSGNWPFSQNYSIILSYIYLLKTKLVMTCETSLLMPTFLIYFILFVPNQDCLHILNGTAYIDHCLSWTLMNIVDSSLLLSMQAMTKYKRMGVGVNQMLKMVGLNQILNFKNSWFYFFFFRFIIQL